jgi:hypothetical protein
MIPIALALLWSTTFRCSTDKYPWHTIYRCSTDIILPMAHRGRDAPWISGPHRAPGPGVSGPHIRGACIWGAPRIMWIPVAHHIYMRHGYVWAHPLEKVAEYPWRMCVWCATGIYICGALFWGAPRICRTYYHKGAISPYLPLQVLTPIDLALALVSLLSTPIFFNYFSILGS